MEYPRDQQLRVIIHHLAGEARREVMVLDGASRTDPSKIFEALRDIYGEKETLASLLNKLHGRHQRPGETTRQFALALQELTGKIQSKSKIPNVDEVLCVCFLEGMRQGPVKIAVSRFARRKGAISFRMLKEEARRIEAEEDMAGCSEFSQAEVSVFKTDRVGGLADSDAPFTLSQLAEELKALRVTMTELSQQVAERGRGSGNQQGGKTRNPGWDDQGRPRCLNCNEWGHMARNCTRRTTESSVTSSRQPSGQDLN
ncbi:paraneoplastic antigen Ma3 homolog [Lytechinus pictus]|uniref:paraneoplastic antigen Ma3 homolog n=1 Tax=Lytechinus pictus TaxID=7653 RepID=UPI0030B9CD67